MIASSASTSIPLVPTFPTDYRSIFVFRLPFNGVNMPIEVQKVGKRQRLSYMNGLAVELIDEAKGVSTWHVYNGTVRTCLQERLESSSTEVFPNLTTFHYMGKEIVNGLECDCYMKSSERPGEFEYFYYDPRLGSPVRWSMHSRDEIFDSHMDDYIVDYLFTQPLSDQELWLHSLPESCNHPTDSMHHVSSVSSTWGRHWRNRHQRRGKIYATGYIPSPERRHIEIYGDHVSLADLHSSRESVLPDSFDWRLNGGVPARVKDQAFCGSCYSFSVIAAIESAYMVSRRNSTSKPLSEQFILDCGWSSGSMSCSGGNQQQVGPLIMSAYNGVVPFDSEYGQYLSTYSYCKNITSMQGIAIDGWVNLPSRPSTNLIKKSLVNQGMLSVSINAVDEIVFYTGGIVSTDACGNTRGKDLNHAVNLVGYDIDAVTGTEYWILRNSWSDNWGEKGFFRVEMGDRDCGISIDLSYPIIKPSHSVEVRDTSTVVA